MKTKLVILFLFSCAVCQAIDLRTRAIAFKLDCMTATVPIGDPVTLPASEPMSMPASGESVSTLTPAQARADELVSIIKQLYQETDNTELRSLITSYLIKAYCESLFIDNSVGQ